MIIKRLVANDVVDEYDRGGTRFLRIRFDPVAEYLAAIDWADANGSDNSKWQALFVRLDKEDFPGKAFLLCLFDSVMTFADHYKISERVRAKLETLVNAVSDQNR